jgi:sulfatase maturation enzyme AslB (radical SAM superfamily)
MLKLNQITALHLELTTKCNARCPMCMRNYRGVDYNSGYPLTELSLGNIKHIFDDNSFLKQIKKINFNGNLGDFSLAADALEIVDFFLSNTTAEIQIETNGSTRTAAWWTRLAHSRIKILFALDGLSDTHGLYRQNTNWEKIIENARAVISHQGNAVWKFIPFKHNQHQQWACQQLATEMGFCDFVVYDQGRNNGPVYTRSGDFSHWLGDAWESIPPVDAMLESHITWFEKYKNTTEPVPKIDCQHLQKQELYIAADGSVYPCCYLGFFPNTMHHAGNQQLKLIVMENNALEYSLDHCLKWFDQIEQSWKQPSVSDGCLYACASTCGIRS